MRIRLKSASVVNEPKRQCWAQTYCQDGLGFLVRVEQSGKDKHTPSEIGHRLLDAIVDAHHHACQQASEASTQLEFRQYVEKALKNEMPKAGKVAFAILRTDGQENLFLGQDAVVLLVRGNKTTVLINGSRQISGELQPEDTILFINGEGGALYGLTNLQHLIAQESSLPRPDVHRGDTGLRSDERRTLDKIAEKLLLQLHQAEGENSVVCLLVNVVQLVGEEAVFPERKKIEERLPAQFLRKLRVVKLKRLGLPSSTFRRKVGLGLILAVVIGGFILLRRLSVPGVSPQQLSENLELARHKYEEGKALVELNRLRARDVLSESKTTLEELRTTLKKGEEEYKKVSELLLAVEQALKEARSAYKTEPDLFFDLSLVRDGLTANLMKQTGNSAFLHSPIQRLIATVNIQTKASKVVAGEKWFADISQMAVTAEKQYVLSPRGITEISNSQQTVIEIDEEWGEIKDLEYFKGNLYLLDKKGFIWKYIPTDDGFASKRNFLKGDLRLQNPHSMAIDGSVWVMADGQVLKFIAGRRDSFYVRGLEEPFGIDAQIIKTAELDNLYILDKQKSRIVVLGEDGVYKSQYIWDGLREVTDFVVSEDLGKIFLLRSDKMYTIKLQ